MSKLTEEAGYSEERSVSTAIKNINKSFEDKFEQENNLITTEKLINKFLTQDFFQKNKKRRIVLMLKGECSNCCFFTVIARSISLDALRDLARQMAEKPAREFLEIPFHLKVGFSGNISLHLDSKGALALLEYLASENGKASAIPLPSARDESKEVSWDI